ncbi:MAG: DHH family phosphoesterase [Phycisphaerales bacterium]|nr:DHH family phosphoesterase [Phycisphaerales bacterium]
MSSAPAALDYRAMSDWLRRFRRPLILTHQRSDGDAVGSVCAAALAMKKFDLDPRVVLFEPIGARYRFLQPLIEWHEWSAGSEAQTADTDCVVIVDTCASAQLEPALAFLRSPPPTLVIDHHVTRDPIGDRAGDLRIIDETAGAAALLIAEWIASAGIRADARMATAILTGLATDTGWFRFSNTNARLLRAAADMLAAGADANKLFNAIYEQENIERVRLTARLLSSLRLEMDGALAVMELRESDFAASGANASMTEDLVNEANRIATVRATALFIEQPGSRIRVNLRSKNAIDVAKIAREFGGGGHANAAGARVEGEWSDVVRRVIGEMSNALYSGQ